LAWCWNGQEGSRNGQEAKDGPSFTILITGISGFGIGTQLALSGFDESLTIAFRNVAGNATMLGKSRSWWVSRTIVIQRTQLLLRVIVFSVSIGHVHGIFTGLHVHNVGTRRE